MSKRIMWIGASCLVSVAILLASCGKTQPTTTTTTTPAVKPTTSTVTPTTTPTTTKPTTTPVTTTKPTTTPTTTPSREEPVYGGTQILGTQSTLASLNIEQAGTDIIYVSSFPFEPLLIGDWARGPAGTNEWNFYHYVYVPEELLKGCLAESWEIPDQKTVIFHIRKGVRYHNKPPVNGRELTADDVVYTFNRNMTNPRANMYAKPYIESVTATDKYTVVFKANQIHSDFYYFVNYSAYIFSPKEMFDANGGEVSQPKAVCGTGPWILDDFVSSSSITFTKNPDYWGYDELYPKNKLPYADTMKFLTIYDLPTRFAAMRSGKVDYIQGVAPQDAKAIIKTNPEIKYGKELDYLNTIFCWRQDLKAEPFSDIRVRKAMAMAIDRNKIIKEYLLGEGVILNGLMMANWTSVYQPIEKYPADVQEQWQYNPAKAKQLLAEAGFPKGFQTELVVESAYAERGEMLAGFWFAVGVDCKIRLVDRATWTSMAWGYGTKTYPHMLAGGGGMTTPSLTMENTLTNAFYNMGSYSDSAFDAKYKEIIGTFDVAKKNQGFKDAMVIYWSSVPGIMFPGQYSYNFWQPWLKNYHGEKVLSRLNQGAVAARIWVDEKLKKEMGR